MGGDEAPVSRRTVERVLRAYVRPDDSGQWSIEYGRPEDVPLVLDTVRPFLEGADYATAEWPHWPTRAVARWVVRLRRGYPEIDDVRLVYYLAVLAARGQVKRVETFLAFTPWRDPEPLFDAVNHGRAPADLLILDLAADFSARAVTAGKEQKKGRAAFEAKQEAARAKKARQRALVEQERKRLEETE